MSRNPGDWVADRDMLALAAADPSLSDGAVRCLCLARFGVMDPEAVAWAKSIAHNLNIAALSQDTPSLPLKPQEAVKPAVETPQATAAGTNSGAQV